MEQVGIILSSIREGRRGEGFANWLHELAAARPDMHVQLIDLRAWPIGPYAAKAPPMVAEAQLVPGSLEHRWAELVRSLDAFVIVTPEYNHGYPGQLKNALDILYPAWNYKPVAFTSYGGFASGVRAVEQLQAVAIELKMVPIRDQLSIRLIGLQADERGAPTEELYLKRAHVMLDELAWWSAVLREARAKRKAKL